ncbi:hypothetical protein Syun_029544 [Stephania yunnanensis]|uniref:Retrotransposon gag domain-containing protein n=1 Tax=Stephania yunnanensis TaxID=152371 RepID=A0AAP0HLG8_9MAGN
MQPVLHPLHQHSQLRQALLPSNRDPHIILGSSSPPFPLSFQPQTPMQLKPLRVFLDKFDGTNPLDWLYQAEQYFNLHSIAPENHLDLTAFFMQGEALSWFQWLDHNHQLSSLEAFTRALELRFGPSIFENNQIALFQLRQTGPLLDYITEFEKVNNRIVGIPLKITRSCFIAGLKPELQHELAIHKPFSLSDVIGVAKLFDSKFANARKTVYQTKGLFLPPQPPLSLQSTPTPAQRGFVLTVMTSSSLATTARRRNFYYSGRTRLPLFRIRPP